jgi:hypothetical protein
VPLPGIPAWQDQDVVLYHGTTGVHVQDVLQAVDETRGNPYKDFGRGFYTTTRDDKALDWAIKKAQVAGGHPAVIQFTVKRDHLADLQSLFFVRGDQNAADFWSFVQYCRTVGVGAGHNRLYVAGWYDLVVGPITGAWKHQTIIPDADQISFHTHQAVMVLNNSLKVQII